MTMVFPLHSEPVIDVRAVAPRLRHARIAQTFESLGGGECLRVVDDHELGPYFNRLLAEYPGFFDWTYEERGPHLWRARIDRLVP
jgi:uncharacterized protein (DUF2249 family)